MAKKSKEDKNIQKGKRMNKKGGIGKFVLLFLAFATFAFAANNGGSFDTFYDILKSWLQGSLGYTIALVGTVMSFVAFMFLRSGTILVTGILVSFLVGGVVGISQTFFDLGINSFAN